MIEITKWCLYHWKQLKKNLLEGTKQQRTRVITKSNLKKSLKTIDMSSNKDVIATDKKQIPLKP